MWYYKHTPLLGPYVITGIYFSEIHLALDLGNHGHDVAKPLTTLHSTSTCNNQTQSFFQSDRCELFHFLFTLQNGVSLSLFHTSIVHSGFLFRKRSLLLCIFADFLSCIFFFLNCTLAVAECLCALYPKIHIRKPNTQCNVIWRWVGPLGGD